MHNIEELRRQFEAAKSRAVEAQNGKEKARTALIEGLVEEATVKLAARGIVAGSRVVPRNRQVEPGIFVGVVSQQYGVGVVPDIRKIKKDGAPHSHQVRWAWVYMADDLVLESDAPKGNPNPMKDHP